MVTANKALLARQGVKLARLAEERGAQLSFEAAVGGGIPIIKTLREALAGNRLTRLYGILNGTCNFILTRMEEGATYADALKEAQSLGYAEADPSFDVEGLDAAQKLAILTSVAFGTEIDRETTSSKAFPRSSRRTSRRPKSSATASSCSPSRNGPNPASSSACIRPWCRATATSPASPA